MVVGNLHTDITYGILHTDFFVRNYIQIKFVCNSKIFFKINYLLLLYFYYYQFCYE